MITTILLCINTALLVTITILIINNKGKEEITFTKYKVRKETNKNKALAISRLIINRCIDINKPISNLMLNRMLFLFYKNCKEWKIYSLKGELEFEAWDYGPVCRVVYNEYSPYGATKLTIREREVKQSDFDGKDYISIEALVAHIVDFYADCEPWKVTYICRDDQGYKDSYVEGEKNIIDDKYYW